MVKSIAFVCASGQRFHHRTAVPSLLQTNYPTWPACAYGIVHSFRPTIDQCHAQGRRVTALSESYPMQTMQEAMYYHMLGLAFLGMTPNVGKGNGN